MMTATIMHRAVPSVLGMGIMSRSLMSLVNVRSAPICVLGVSAAASLLMAVEHGLFLIQHRSLAVGFVSSMRSVIHLLHLVTLCTAS